MHDVFTNLLVSSPNSGGLFLIHQGLAYKLDSLDTTGLVVGENQILRALQPARLLQFGSAQQDDVTSDAVFDDIHDVLADENCRYVVKTETNEIVKLDQCGREQQRWTLPGERDSWHANCLARWNGRLIFSAFGDLRLHREYKTKSRGFGIVQDLETGEKLINGLSQPHSLLADGEKLLLANSESFEIREYDADGDLLRTKKLDGYTRGMFAHEGVLFVGLSKSRNVDTGLMAHAMVVALDAESWEEIGRHPLPVNEIYSIQRVSDVAMAETLAKLASHANRLLGEQIVECGRFQIHLTERIEILEQQTEQLRIEMAVKDDLILGKDAQIHDFDEANRDNERKIYGLLETVHGKDIHIQSREDFIRGKDLEIQRRDEVIHNKEREIQNRDEVIRCKEAEFRVRDETVRRLESQMVESRADLLVKDKIVAEMEFRIANQGGQMQAMGEDLRRKDEVIHNHDEVIRGLNGQYENRIAMLTEEKQHRDEVIERLRTEIHVQAQRIEEMDRNADAMHSKLYTLTNRFQMSLERIRDMESSRSWRVTRPMRAIKLAFIGHKSPKTNSPGRSESGHSAHNDLGQKGPSSLGSSLLSPEAEPAPALVTPRLDLRGSSFPVVILTVPHCTYVAEEIEAALQRVGIKSRIIYGMPEAGYDDVPHFVICPQMFERLPNLYISFQMEQSISSRWFTPEYMRKLENSFAIMDYSLTNIAKLQDMGLYPQQMYHVPIGYLQDYTTIPDAEPAQYDVIFYGDIQNTRRREFIAELGKVCKVKVINDLFGAPLHAELAQARLVVNIHYYAGALLETTRLWECLSLGKLVVSERSVDMDQHDDLAALIDFVDVDDVAGMVDRVRHWLRNEDLRKERIEYNCKALQAMPNQFDTRFYRFLLATDNITFEEFWSLVGQRMKLPGDKLCLNLPEFVRRSQSFDRDNHFGFARFTGLRHSKGWLGCAMSYKLMIMLARQECLPSLTICEDDVEFPKDFETRWAVVQQHLREKPDDWDVFSGLMADLHEDARILNAYVQDGTQFAVTDKLISMVFNVYNARMFDLIAAWDEKNRDVENNTIDRYLESRGSMRVITTHPFLVGHKEELHSTLWGFQNTQYSALIENSNGMLGKKLCLHAKSAPESS